MKKMWISIFLAVSLIVACSQENYAETMLPDRNTQVTLKEQITPDFFPSHYNIVSIGDSLTQGVGDSTKSGGYIPYLIQYLEEEKSIKDVDVYNFGVSGNRTSQVLTRLNTKKVKTAIKDADIVMITTGGNDVMKVVKENFSKLDIRDFEKELVIFEKQLTTMIESIRIQNASASVVLIGLYNPFHHYFEDVKEMDMVVAKWNDVSRNVLARYPDTVFVDVALDFKESEENLLYSDYFHPNDKGYEIMANNAFKALQIETIHELAERKFLASRRESEEYEE